MARRTFTPVVDNFTVIKAEQINPLYLEVQKIAQSTPSADFSTIVTLTGTLNLVDASEPIQAMNCNGASRQVNLPAVASTNHSFYIANTSSLAFDLLIGNPSGVIIATLRAGDAAIFMSDKVRWYALGTKSETYFAGVYSAPAVTLNENGTVTLGIGTYVTFQDENYLLPVKTDVIAGTTYALEDGVTNYLVFTGTTGAISVIQNRSSINQSNVIPIVTIYREGFELHIIEWGELARGLPNRLSNQLVRTYRFVPETGGFAISSSPIRVLEITGGTIWFGGASLVAHDFSSAHDPLDFWYHTGGVWTKQTVGQYDNLHFDDGTNLQEVGNNKFVTIYAFRGVENEQHAYFIVGTASYTLAEAQASGVPPLPPIIASQGMLVGRIIIEKGTDVPTNVSSAFTVMFSRTPVTRLSELSGDTLITPSTTVDALVFDGVWKNQPLFSDLRDPTGWVPGSVVTRSYDKVTRTVTLTGNLAYYWLGVKHTLVSPWTSPAHADTNGVWFLSSQDGSTFVWTVNEPWTFPQLQVAFINYGTVHKWGINEVHGNDGAMPWAVHEELHDVVGTYKKSGGTNLWPTALPSSTLPANRRPDVIAAILKDEDNITSIPSLSSKLYTRMSLTGSGVIDLTVNSSDIVPDIGGIRPQYNQFTGSAWVQTAMPVNSYMCVWKIGVPVTDDADSQQYRFIWVQGQSAGTLASQTALTTADVALGNLSGQASEFVFLTKTILRYIGGDWSIESESNLLGSRVSQSSAAAGAFLSAVTTDATLTGDGSPASPLTVFQQYVKTIAISSVGGVSGISSGGINPAITINLGAITPSSVNGLGFSLETPSGFKIVGNGLKQLLLYNSLIVTGFNQLTFENAENLIINKGLTSGGGLGVLTWPDAGATLTIPATGVAALLGAANAYTAANTFAAKIGIGSGALTPLYTLHAKESANNTVIGYLHNSSSGGYGLAVAGGAGTKYALDVRNYLETSLMTMLGSGRLGIGTQSPLRAVQIGDGIPSSVDTVNLNLATLNGSVVANTVGKSIYTFVGEGMSYGILEAFNYEPPAAMNLVINPNGGTVAIGTSSPSAGLKLHVASRGPNIPCYAGVSNSDSSSYVSFYSGSSGDSAQAIYWPAANDMRFGPSSNINSTGFAEKMRITSAGALGLGKTPALALLDVNGAICSLAGGNNAVSAANATLNIASGLRFTYGGKLYSLEFGINEGDAVGDYIDQLLRLVRIA